MRGVYIIVPEWDTGKCGDGPGRNVGYKDAVEQNGNGVNESELNAEW